MLKPGTQLGPYQILSQLGSGGMGEVYKARDTRLERFVAIKVLPEHLADNPELRERFEREARTIAKLNHPHICTLHDIGRQDEIDYLVMEYLEGETLAERLKKGSLPLEQVLRYAVEVSDALDKAHRAGVTHRDIKPGNVIVTKSGTKLLDFGLAKLKQDVFRATTPASEMPTVPGALTEHGTLLGTLHYMAPEQVEGKVNEIDARTDVFAFGALVYEMATGKRAFPGETQASVIAKIFEVDPPPISSFEPPGKLTPPSLDRVVKKCLRKDREDRWQSARDLHDELRWITEGGSQPVAALMPEPERPPPPVPLWRRGLPWALALVLAAVAGAGAWHFKAVPSRPVARFTISPPPGQRVSAGLRTPALALSPDGSQMVYVGNTATGTSTQLYIRPLDSLDARPIVGTEGGDSPFFSPDGQWIGFFESGGNLKKVPISGGGAVTLTSAQGIEHGASWGANGSIVFHARNVSPLMQVSAEGGTAEPFTSLAQGEVSHHWPEFLPGGDAVVFAAYIGATWDGAKIVVQRLSGERKVLVEGGTNPHYVAPGYLLFTRAGTLLAAPFDLKRLELTAAPVPVAEGIMESQFGAAQVALSPAGSLVYIPGSSFGESSLVWVDRTGTAQPLPAPPRGYGPPRLSPEGQRIAALIQGNVWVYDISRDTLTRLTFEPSASLFCAWTPDGKRITFAKSNPSGLFWKSADGSGSEERLTTSEGFTTAGSWSPDGKVLSFFEINSQSNTDLWVLPMTEDRKPSLFLQTPFIENGPSFSPDGRWIAYISDESGRQEIYVQPYPGPGGKRQISTEGGSEPVWARSGELFFRSGDKMMVVETTLQPTFSAGKPRVLFEGSYLHGPAGLTNYDVSADGQRFLMLKSADQKQEGPQINVVLNWSEELKRRVPAP